MTRMRKTPAASTTSVIDCSPRPSRSSSSRPATASNGSALESTTSGRLQMTVKTWNEVAKSPISCFDASSDVMMGPHKVRRRARTLEA